MNKKEFLDEIRRRLSSYPAGEVEKTISYYDEIISDRVEDGEDEETAVKALGSIEDIIKNATMEMSLSSIIKAKVNDSAAKVPSNAWWIVLAIIGSPIWMPLLFAFAIVVFAIYIVTFSLVASLYVVEFALGFSGIAAFFAGIVTIFTVSPAAGLFEIGLGCILIALTIFFFEPLKYLVKGLMFVGKACINGIKSLFVKKGGSSHENN